MKKDSILCTPKKGLKIIFNMGIQNKFLNDHDLSTLSSYKIGGPAKYFFEAKAKDDLCQAIEWAKDNNVQFWILGGGTNVLINDKGIEGLVIRLSNENIDVKGERIICGAGANLVKTSRKSASAGLSGLEWAIGIPGTVGGAIRGNAGAYGDSISTTVENVEIFRVKNLKFYKISSRDCEFGYRESIFKHNDDLLIWEVILKMAKSDEVEIKKTIDSFLEKRDASQPKLPSAGCVFKNIFYSDLEKANAELAKEAMEGGIVKQGKVSAGWIVSMLGIKGKSIGGAKVSLEHANFIINTGKATASDVSVLISYIKQQSRDKFKVQLQEEIQYFGF